jgi:hypothetical protein
VKGKTGRAKTGKQKKSITLVKKNQLLQSDTIHLQLGQNLELNTKRRRQQHDTQMSLLM